MEKIILAHFSFSGDFRNLSLSSNSAVDLEYFNKESIIKICEAFGSTKSLYFLDERVYCSECFFDITLKEGIFFNNKREGFSVYKLILEGGYSFSGYFKGYYSNGKEEGLWVCYCENGQKYSESFYENGKEEGLWITYRDNGEINMSILYSKGKFVKYVKKPDSSEGL